MIVFVYQAALLEDHMKELRRVIRPGARRLNWNSLGINDFVAKCDAVSSIEDTVYIKYYVIAELLILVFTLLPVCIQVLLLQKVFYLG